MSSILLHLCCGPCTLFPLKQLRALGLTVQGYFYNPNIHPYQEFSRRLECLEDLAVRLDLPVVYERDYGLKEYLRRVVYQEEERCSICYEMRLEATARKALELGAAAFSSTLLYSRYQKHETIRQLGEEIGKRLQISFYYQDFRQGWQEGIERSREMELYRQPYCGCIYSEQDRYDSKSRKKSGPTSAVTTSEKSGGRSLPTAPAGQKAEGRAHRPPVGQGDAGNKAEP